MNAPVWKWDADTETGYLKLQSGSVEVASSAEVWPNIIVDFDNDHTVIGIEVLS